MTMAYFVYLATFRKLINKNHPDIQKRTIENYLETFAVLPPPLEKPEKSSAAGNIFRMRGQQHFLSGKFRDAAISYTVGLMHAPPNSECAAVIIADRSAALYRLGLWEECITDIGRALRLPHPARSKNKIIERKKAAMAKLNDDLSKKNGESSSKVDDDSKYAHGDNVNLPGASNGIKIKHDSKNRRKLIAKKAFKAGQIILREKPYLIVPEMNENPTFCYHCLKDTLCLISCDRCNKQIYCSEECRSKAFLIYHRTECPLMNTLVAGNLIDSRSRIRQLKCLIIFTEQGRDIDEFWLESIENQSSGPAQLEPTEEKYIGHTRQAFLSLPVKDTISNQEMLYEAAYLVTLLKNHTEFFKNDIDIPIAAKMLIKLGISYASHHFEIPYVGQFYEKASAAFPLVSLATHSCISNTVAYTNTDNSFVLRASQYIKPGDEILYNYRDITFKFDETNPGKDPVCKRSCAKCERAWLHTIKDETPIKIDDKLRDKLLENPYNIEALWELKMFLYGQGERYRLQVQVIKIAIGNAYRKFNDRETCHELFRHVGIL